VRLPPVPGRWRGRGVGSPVRAFDAVRPVPWPVQCGGFRNTSGVSLTMTGGFRHCRGITDQWPGRYRIFSGGGSFSTGGGCYTKGTSINFKRVVTPPAF